MCAPALVSCFHDAYAGYTFEQGNVLSDVPLSCKAVVRENRMRGRLEGPHEMTGKGGRVALHQSEDWVVNP
jgi:hypothetical protein